eukprot:SAG31_NODE_2541_length_5536_cov_2.014162_4_plen_72_part_00
MLSIDDGFAKLVKMRGGTGDCWENAKHEQVCKDNNTCKFACAKFRYTGFYSCEAKWGRQRGSTMGTKFSIG